MAHKTLTISLPEELLDIVERARSIEHRSRSEIIQEAIRRYFGEPVYVPTDEERRLLGEALTDLERSPEAGRSWRDVKAELWPE